MDLEVGEEEIEWQKFLKEYKRNMGPQSHRKASSIGGVGFKNKDGLSM